MAIKLMRTRRQAGPTAYSSQIMFFLKVSAEYLGVTGVPGWNADGALLDSGFGMSVNKKTAQHIVCKLKSITS